MAAAVLLLAVMAQLAVLLHCYRWALRHNARRLQLWVGARLPGRGGDPGPGVRVRCRDHAHGLVLCPACCAAALGHAAAPHQASARR